MHRRFSPILLVVSLAPGCLQKVDGGLAASQKEIDPPACGGAQGYACMFPINTTDPGIGLKADQAGDVTENAEPGGGCTKVDLDVTDILARKCAGCHEGAGTAINSPLTFILDPDQLINTPSSMQFKGEPYVLPGDPAGSLIYQRAVINKDMPYSASTLVPPNYLTVSEASVLYQWIASCVAPAPPMAGGSGAGGMDTGGMSAGGMSAGGVNAGGMDAGGMDAGGMSAGGMDAGGMSAGGMDAGGMSAGGTAAGGAGAGGMHAGGAGAGAGGMHAGGTAAGGTAAGGAGGGVTGGGSGRDNGGSGGTASGGTGGAVGNALPCDHLCADPTNFSVPPSFESPALGAGGACYQTVSTLRGFSCGNAFRRTFAINGTTVDCGSAVAIDTIPARNGGYCVQATAGRNNAAFFRAN